ncbi:MAG: TetR/AcrR family transcriptional regulator [Bacteroidota bacterium]
MDDLALLLRVSKSTVYEYFGTKEEILSYVVEVKIEEMQLLKDDLIPKFLAAPHDLVHLQAYLLALPKGISAHFLQELKQHFPTVWGKVWEYLENLLDDLRSYYEVGISSGSFQPISPQLLVMIDRFFLTQLFAPPDFLGEDYSLEKMVKEYVKLRFEGLELRG